MLVMRLLPFNNLFLCLDFVLIVSYIVSTLLWCSDLFGGLWDRCFCQCSYDFKTVPICL